MNDSNEYEKLTSQDKWNTLAMVSNLYYNTEMTQSEIAERMYTSRSKISRMLKEARQKGIVEITIKEPWERRMDLEEKIMELYQVKDIRVVNTEKRSHEGIVNRISEVAAYYFDAIVQKDMTVGISWGNTLYHFVDYIAANNVKNIPITVVPIMGASNINRPQRDSMDLAKDLASAYGGSYQYLYAPVFVGSKDIKDGLTRDEAIQSALQTARNADVILTSVGSVASQTWQDYLGEKSFKILSNAGAVGHIGGHFFDGNGKEIRSNLPDRMIGISMEDIRACKNVICIAYEAHKADAVRGALRSGMIDTFILDSSLAQAVIEA